MSAREAGGVSRQLLEHDAESWSVGPRMAWAMLVGPFVVLGLMAALLVVRPVFLALTSEDGPVEWAQVVVVVLVAATSAGLGLTCWRHGLRLLAIGYALASLMSMFVALEEISWGQRIINLVTPAALEAINRQGETNVHNIPVVQRLFGIAELAVAVYAVIASAVVAVRRPAIPHLYLVVPPLFVASLFLIPAVYRLMRYTVVQEAGQTLNRFAEVGELMLYLGILAFVVLALRRLRAEAPGANRASETTTGRLSIDRGA